MESPCKKCLDDCHAVKGCPAWREWFMRNWNRNIHVFAKYIPKKQKEKEKWIYEHPDYVREGIKWEG